MTEDVSGELARNTMEVGVVRAVYPDLWRVDIEPQTGGLLRKAQVNGDVLPEVHIDVQRPSYVEWWYRGGKVQDPQCRPINFRRFYGPETADDGHERHFYHKNQQIVRVKDITIRITPDNRVYLFDAESNDYLLYDMNARTIHTIVPHIFMGTDEGTRYEYHKDQEVRIVIPKSLIGQTAVQDADGITYLAQQLIHLVSALEVKATAGAEINLIAPLIKLTASSIILDPVNIKLGAGTATERIILGDLFRTFLNTFFTLFNAHTHTGVQPGVGTSGSPTTPATPMDTSMLSDVAHVSKAGI